MHLREAFPEMEAKVRSIPASLYTIVEVSITRYKTADLADRDARIAAKRRVDAELERFTRHDWDPLHGIRNSHLGIHSSIDPELYAAALADAPELGSAVSFAEFTRTARPGDVLEHLAGKETHQGKLVVITAISARRLTTRSADPAADARSSCVPIQGGSCFVCDGDLICFKHSGFAHQGGYSLVRWIRQP